MKRTPIGKRRTRVTVYEPNRSANSYNEQVPAYDKLYCKRWGYMAPSSGREFTAAQQTNSQVTAILRLPYDKQTAAITADMRATIGTRVLNIGAVFDEQDAQREIVVWCTEVE